MPIIGIGGVITGDDAIEFLLCGASAVQVGTANFVNPKAPLEILQGIRRYLTGKKINRMKSLIGKLKT